SEPLLPGTGTAKADLAVELFARRTPDGAADGIDAVLEYSSDLCDESTARSFADRLAHLLGLLVAAPDPPVREAEVLLPEESAAVRAGWAATTVDEPCTGVVERVRAHAAAHPDRIAVQDPAGSATYAEPVSHAPAT